MHTHRLISAFDDHYTSNPSLRSPSSKEQGNLTVADLQEQYMASQSSEGLQELRQQLIQHRTGMDDLITSYYLRAMIALELNDKEEAVAHSLAAWRKDNPTAGEQSFPVVSELVAADIRYGVFYIENLFKRRADGDLLQAFKCLCALLKQASEAINQNDGGDVYQVMALIDTYKYLAKKIGKEIGEKKGALNSELEKLEGSEQTDAIVREKERLTIQLGDLDSFNTEYSTSVVEGFIETIIQSYETQYSALITELSEQDDSFNHPVTIEQLLNLAGNESASLLSRFYSAAPAGMKNNNTWINDYVSVAKHALGNARLRLHVNDNNQAKKDAFAHALLAFRAIDAVYQFLELNTYADLGLKLYDELHIDKLEVFLLRSKAIRQLSVNLQKYVDELVKHNYGLSLDSGLISVAELPNKQDEAKQLAKMLEETNAILEQGLKLRPADRTLNLNKATILLYLGNVEAVVEAGRILEKLIAVQDDAWVGRQYLIALAKTCALLDKQKEGYLTRKNTFIEAAKKYITQKNEQVIIDLILVHFPKNEHETIFSALKLSVKLEASSEAKKVFAVLQQGKPRTLSMSELPPPPKEDPEETEQKREAERGLTQNELFEINEKVMSLTGSSPSIERLRAILQPKKGPYNPGMMSPHRRPVEEPVGNLKQKIFSLLISPDATSNQQLKEIHRELVQSQQLFRAMI